MRSGMAASALGHLSLLTVFLIFAEVHPFGTVTAEPITVDIVPSDEAPPPRKEEPLTVPKDAVELPSKSTSAASSPPAASQPAAPPAASQPAASAPAAAQPPASAPAPQKQAALLPPRPEQQQPVVQPQQPAVQPQAASPTPVYKPPEPDISLKYHVLLGLPPELPAVSAKDDSGDGNDAQASEKANLASGLIAEFRRHLKTCSKLPASISPSDNLRIKLRAFMTPEGKLSAAPVLLEASASAKGPALMQSAIAALQACQPYAMLPVDRYGEWKVLDLSFTPQDFAGGS
jgi:hypothetical protein